jgi:ankyrin repeat protein
MKRLTILLTLFLFVININYANNIDGFYRQTILNRGYRYSETGFFKAIRKNDIKTINLFFQAGMNPNIWCTGRPATMHALFYKKNEVLDLLLKNGADIETEVPPMRVSRNSQNLLSFAIKRKNKKAVEILIKHGVDVNKTFNKKTPLEYAKIYKQSDIAELLIKHGAK